jgi:hypothetical protein
MTAATAFIAAIADDPMVELPVPQAEVVHLDPPVMRPLQDGSQYINRGNPEQEASQPFQPALPNPAIDPDAAWWQFNNPLWASPGSEASG